MNDYQRDRELFDGPEPGDEFGSAPMALESYIPPVLDARRAWGVAESQITRAQSVMPGTLEGIARRMTPRSMPTVRPAADPCADFERAVHEEGEPSARLMHLARVWEGK